ncbi:MAG: S9 family peptidase [Rickettsia endosymbiont of Bryobia graminum]|nr:S9 family peptidase [Rickettsia endosymbiont of Bryobia graminum]
MNSTIALAESNNPIIPRKILFGNPNKIRVKLSYDGKYITYIAPLNNILNIWLAPSNDLSKASPVTNDKGRGIRSYSWSYNNNILYSQDQDGDENFRIYNYNIQNKQTTLLTPEKGVKAYILGISHKMPNEILISMNDRDPKYFDIYKLDLITLKKELVFKNGKYSDFTIDDDLQVRFASLIDEEGGAEYYQLKDDKETLFTKVSAEDATNTSFFGFDKTGRILYLLDSRERNTAALKSLNLDNNKLTIIAEDSKADVDIFTVHPTKSIIQAVEINYEKTRYNILDKSIEKDINYLTGLSKGNLIVTTRTLDDSTWLVAFDIDNGPVKYYKYDRNKNKAEFLFNNRDDLENYKLASMLPVIIKSRDGLDLVSYITFPVGIKLNQNNLPDKQLPLIIYVHGGPCVRDSWGYDPTHQWLANRGYAVLSINYRSSTGFGKNFISAGYLEWGRKMHDDLLDGVNWAIKNNIADSEKIAIMGGSYGGYATLVGLTMTPDVFVCGVDLVGPSNLLTLINSVPSYWKPILGVMKKRIGPWDTEEDKKKLAERSPLTYVNNIKKPLFIAQGAHDPRVKQAESDQIVSAMRSKKIPVVYALYENEGHGFARPENRLSYYAMVEYFLANILGGKKEDIGNDLQDAKFLLNSKENITNTEAEEIINKEFIK